MDKEETILEEAISKLKEYSMLSVNLKSKGSIEPSILIINQTEFSIYIKSDISIGNKGAILSILKEASNKSSLPIILVVNYIPSDITKEFIAANINYLDIAGNCSIKGENLVVQIEGKKRIKTAKTNQSRAFQEAGIKLIFSFLINPKAVQCTYRELSKLADISLGSVGSIMQELTELHFILKTKDKVILKNKPQLLQRWVIAYHDVLRQRLLLKRMQFVNADAHKNWKKLPLQQAENTVLWGAEPAASLLTNHLSPGKFVIYSNGLWNSLIADLKLTPSENGEIEVLKIFWDEQNNYKKESIVPPLLVYADLIGSGNDRNIETAKIILENELSYLK